jgi:hypothetical protein
MLLLDSATAVYTYYHLGPFLVTVRHSRYNTTTMANSTLKTIHPWLQENTTETPSGATIKSYSHDNGSDPILCVVHGYPQSSYQCVLPFNLSFSRTCTDSINNLGGVT